MPNPPPPREGGPGGPAPAEQQAADWLRRATETVRQCVADMRAAGAPDNDAIRTAMHEMIVEAVEQSAVASPRMYRCAMAINLATALESVLAEPEPT